MFWKNRKTCFKLDDCWYFETKYAALIGKKRVDTNKNFSRYYGMYGSRQKYENGILKYQYVKIEEGVGFESLFSS